MAANAPQARVRDASTSPDSLENLDRSKTSDSYLTARAAIANMDLSRLPSLVSPCYLHRRFDDAVNIEKVLEEIACDEAMSHSRLVQTATGVRELSRQLQQRPIRRAVRNILIVTKARDNELVTLTRELAEWLLTTPRYGSDVGVNVYVDAKLQASSRFDAPQLLAKNRRFENMLRYWTPELCSHTPEKFDMVLTLGGDGTVLYTSWLFQQIVPPVLSFSLGSLGFLTPFDFQGYRQRLDSVMGGLSSSTELGTNPSASNLSSKVDIPNASSRDILNSIAFPSRSATGTSSPAYTSAEVIPDAGMRVNLRMRFTCSVHRATRFSRSSSSTSSSRHTSTPSLSSGTTASPTGHPSMPPSSHPEPFVQFEVLNEIVIDRGPSPYVSNLELFGDDQLLTVIQADGCIFSTPTGSTAYSLSAGGSLVHPSIPAILLTPICPHTLSFRPMLLNDTISLRVAVPRSSRAGAWCSFDGKMRMELRPGDYVTIRASRYPFATVVGEREGWIDSVSRTLRWNTREARQKSWTSPAGTRGGGRRGQYATPAVDRAATSSIQEQDEELSGEEVGDIEQEQVQEAFDIDFDEDDAVSGTESGYGGEGSTTTSPPASGGVAPRPSKDIKWPNALSL